MENWHLDQALAGLRDLATGLWTYYCDLTGEGFSPDQALKIVIAWQSDMMGYPPKEESE